MSERGSATIVMCAVVAILATGLVATGSLGLAYAARAQAALAADAASLAAAVATYPGTGRGPPAVEASRAARGNGASVIGCICPLDAALRVRVATVRAVVRIMVPLFGRLDVGATSRAEFDPVAWLGG